MTTIKALLFGIMLCTAVLAQAQTGNLDGGKGKREIIAMGLYPPDLIMKHQQRLGISDAQRSNISRAVKNFQSEVAELQWTMQNDQQQLRQSLSGYSIKTDQALAQAEQVLTLESQFKLAHFKLLIAIKNELTQEQIDMIKLGIREKMQQKMR